MTPVSSSKPATALMDRLIRYQELHRLAVRGDDIPAANRHVEKVWGAIDELAAQGAEGRKKLEELLDHPIAYLRLRAAEAMIEWASEQAVPVLGRLLVEDLGADSSVAERIDIRTDAKDSLFVHFGIRSFDRNDLIGPLRRYGIELPYRDHEKWR